MQNVGSVERAHPQLLHIRKQKCIPNNMKATPQSEKILDKQIAQLEGKLGELRKKKLSLLQERYQEAERAMQMLQSSIKGGPVLANFAGRSSKSISTKGGPRGPRLSEEEVVERLTKVVKAAGEEGISARSAAEEAGVFYLRAIKVMDANFKKTGVAKWTRYRLK